jgi:hypothetical protein
MGNTGSLILQRKDAVSFTFIHMIIVHSAMYKKLASFSLITQKEDLSRFVTDSFATSSG